MNIYTFIGYAKDLREGKTMVVGTPPRIKRNCQHISHRRYVQPRLDAHYGALHRFRIKHPDSTRTERARRRELARYTSRFIKGAIRDEEAYKDFSQAIIEDQERVARQSRSRSY